MSNRHCAAAIFFSIVAFIGLASSATTSAKAGPVSSVVAFDVCSLLSSGEAASIMSDPKVVKRGFYGPPGFFCAWNSPSGTDHQSHDILISFFTQSKLRQLHGHLGEGLGTISGDSPLNLFQAIRKKGQSCLGYSGSLPCAEIAERIALYKHTNVYDYVALIFAQREEGGGDAGIVRLVLDAAHVANRITPRLP